MTDSQAMSCPVCRVPLVMSDRQGVEIDYCPQCRGVWLDRGELDKIIERSAREYDSPQPAPPPQQPQPRGYDHDHDRGYGRHHGGHHHKRRKSFLEELFD
jgi:Zn-finger nucleic acid-binding protein